jgi:hypothetical protein
MDQPRCLLFGLEAELTAHSPAQHRFATEPAGYLEQSSDFGF